MENSEILYSTLIEALPHRVFVKDLNSRFVSCNSLFAAELGIDPPSIAGQSDFDYFPVSLAEKYKADDQIVISTGRKMILEEPYFTQGSFREIRTIKSPVRDNEGKTTGILGIIIDITEEYKVKELTRESELKYRTIFHKSPTGFGLTTLNGEILEINEEFVRKLGYQPHEIPKINSVDFYFESEDRRAIIQEVLTKGSCYRDDFRMKKKDGTPLPVQIKVNKVVISGKEVLLSNIIDISEQKAIEKSLRYNEKRLQEAETMARMGNWELDLHTNKISWSEGEFQLYGIPADDPPPILEEVLSFIHPEDRELVNSIITNSVESGSNFSSHHRIIRADGQIRHMVAKGRIHFSSDCKPEKILGVDMDITELKEAEASIRKLNEELENRVKSRTLELEEALEQLREREKALKFSEEKFRAMMEQSPLGISMYTPEGILLQANSAWKKIWNITNPESLTGNYNLFGENVIFQSQSYSDEIQKILNRNSDEMKPSIIETFVNSTSGKHIRSFIYPLKNLQNQITHIIITDEDITREKIADEVMKSAISLARKMENRTSEEIIQEGLDEAVRLSGSSMGFFHSVDEKSGNLTLQKWSKNTMAYCSAEGEGQHYPISKAGIWVEPIYTRKAAIHNNYNQVPDRKGLPKGHVPMARELIVPVFEKDQIVALLGVGNKLQDYDDFDLDQISFYAQHIWSLNKIKSTEEALNKSQTLYKTLIDTVPGAVTLYDRKGNFLFASAGTAELLKLESAEEIIGRNHLEFLIPEDKEILKERLEIAFQNGYIRSTEINLLRPNGELIPVELMGEVIYDENGQPIEMLILSRDISKRKEAESALRESEERYKSIFTNNQATMLLVHPTTGIIIDANPAACEYYGYPFDQFAGLNYSTISEDSEEEINVHFKEVITQGKYHYYSRHLLYKDEVRDVEVYAGILPIQMQQYMYLIIHDNTERKRAEEQLIQLAKSQTALLREVNHRVKNNLAALISMLHIEEDRAEIAGNSSYIHLLRDLISRIRGLSTVHTMLSQKNWLPLEISQLCEQIILGALQSAPRDCNITLQVEKSSIVINANQAHHLTLIVNELATNSIKHALSPKKELRISARFEISQKRIIFNYSDNGPGFPEEFLRGDYSKANVGFELIRGTVEHSLEGELKLQNHSGAEAIITFNSEF